ncbi:hypothetical protein SOVF_019080 [Spinacia oleracea]|nr:hypothetical protein SOVF_019080 [Spinacia oleracea]
MKWKALGVPRISQHASACDCRSQGCDLPVSSFESCYFILFSSQARC